MTKSIAAARSVQALLAVALLAGCASQQVAMTHHLREQYRLSPEDLKNLQYYVSADITLQREFRKEEGGVSPSHKLLMKEEGVVEQVVIRSNTPGIATDAGPTSLTVRFEPGASLVFASPDTDADPERKYKLSARRWVGDAGEIVYGDKTYHAVEGSGGAYLVVDMETLDQVEKTRTVLPGMKLPGK